MSDSKEESSLEEILGAGIAEAHLRAEKAEEENALLRSEIAMLRAGKSEPPESTQAEIKSPNGWRIRAPWWLALIVAVLAAAIEASRILRGK